VALEIHHRTIEHRLPLSLQLLQSAVVRWKGFSV